MPAAPDLDRMQLLTGAAAVVLGEVHPATIALARAITTKRPGDLRLARAEVKALPPMARFDLVQVVERAAGYTQCQS